MCFSYLNAEFYKVFCSFLCVPFLQSRTIKGLNNIPLPRFAGAMRKRFCFFGCFIKIFDVKKPKQAVDALGYSYQLVVSKSCSCLHAAVLVLYTSANSRGCSLVLNSDTYIQNIVIFI